MRSVTVEEELERLVGEEYAPEHLARIFFHLRAQIFGLTSFSCKASVASFYSRKSVSSPFVSLSESLVQWQREGLVVNVGDYFRALFGVFKKSTYPSHVVAECGLSIYLQSRVQSVKSAPELTSCERGLFREEKIVESMANFGWTRDRVIEMFGASLPDSE